MKKIIFLIIFLSFLFLVPKVSASDNSYVSIVNPIRGNDFWSVKDQKPETAVLGQTAILKSLNLSATWLIRFDALEISNITDELKNRPIDEKGLFLEVTPIWASQANIQYHRSDSWHNAGSAFLTGYEPKEREELIDTAFEKFKKVFGYYPTSVGAWWIDSYSLGYMQKKYGITSDLVVSDQYSTDNYQIWGQYFSTPYYPSKNNALYPAQTLENKLNVVTVQWAPRDPVNSYGNGVMESTFSLQANDYMDYHNLDINYFSALIDTYTNQQFNQFAHMVVGLENSYEWNKYSGEYQKQMEVLNTKRKLNQISVVTMKDFANWYINTFPKTSSSQIVIANDPLGSFKKVVWFMDPYYRAGWFYNQNGSVFRDIRQYIDSEEELCFKQRCDSVNFATSATRVLDDVSFGNSWMIDEGKINNFKVEKLNDDYILSYANEIGNVRKITFLPRDIGVDGKFFSIDSAILNATKKENLAINKPSVFDTTFKWSLVSVLSKTLIFLIFLIFGTIMPGFVLTKKIFNRNTSTFLKISVSFTVGLVMLSLFFYITSLLKIRPLIFIYIILSLFLFIRLKLYRLSVNLSSIKNSYNILAILTILAGVIFQTIPTLRSGLNFNYGIGFWGPNTHDGVWHMALVNQLINSVPPENPIFSGAILKNYHFFYDLTVAATTYISRLSVSDLIFRFYPITFSLVLGIGSYYLILRLFENNIDVKKAKIAAIFSLYFIYFSGSFGWIVEFLRERHFGGESAFWANQAISFNLNPPFAISLVIIIAFLHILFNSSRLKNSIVIILLGGMLIGFKSYGAILILVSLVIVGLLRKQLSYLIVFVGSLIISAWIFLANFELTSSPLVFAPFWLINTMIDSPDRVGWARLSLAREVGFATKNWFKFTMAEILSLFIFIIGNLGIRAIGLLSLAKIKDIVENEKFLFILVFSSLSFLIPILFIQSGNPWNTIQFSYYGLYVVSLAAGVVLTSIIFKLPRFFSLLIICLVLIFTPINSIVTATGYLVKKPHAFIPAQELAGLQFLASQQSGTVLTYPYDEKMKQKIAEPWPILAYDSTAYVSAFSKKSIFLEDEPQNQILLTDYKKRLVASRDFFLKPIFEEAKFLSDNQIKYIYLQKIFNTKLDESSGVVKNIFENEEVVIYEVR